MAAPDTAQPIAPDGKDGKGQSIKHIRVKCTGCKWKGHVGELLGVDDEETLWCPTCGTSAWVYT